MQARSRTLGFHLFALLGLLFVASPARAQWVTFDPTNWIQNFTTAANSIESITKVTQQLNKYEEYSQRMGKLTDMMNQLRTVAQTASRIQASIEAVKQVRNNGNWWSAMNVAQMWGVDPNLTSSFANIMQIKNQIDMDQANGMHSGSIASYRHATANLIQHVAAYQRERERQQAVENSQLARSRAEEANSLASQSSGSQQTAEAQLGRTNTIMALQLSAAESQTQMVQAQTDRMLSEARAREESEKQGYDEAVTSALGLPWR